LLWAQGYDCDEPLFPRYDRKARLWGYTGVSRQFVIPPTYTKAYVHEERYAIVLMGMKYGVIDCNGTLVVPAEYEDIDYFNVGRGWAKKDNLYALINAKNKQLTPHLFSEIKPVTNRGSATWVKKDNKWGFFDKNNVRYIVNPEYDAVNNMSDSAAIVKKGNEFSIFDYDFNTIVLDKIDVIYNTSEFYMAFRRLGKWGVIAKSSRTILTPTYDTVYQEGSFFVTKLKGKYGLYSLRGKQASAEKLEAVGKWNEDYLPYKQGNKWGFARLHKDPLLPAIFDEAGFVQDSVSIVMKDGKYDLYRVASDRLVATKFAYDSIYRSYKNRIIVGVKDGQHFVIGNEGNRRQSAAYSYLFAEDSLALMRYKKGAQMGYVNAGTSQEIGGLYDFVEGQQFGFGIVTKAGKKGVINTQGKEIVGCNYNIIKVLKRGNMVYLQVGNEANFGLIDGLGNRIFPDEFSLISLEGNFIKVKTKNGYGVTDLKGNYLQKPSFTFMANEVENGVSGFSFPTVVQQRKKFSILVKPGAEPIGSSDSLKILGDAMFASKEKQGWQLWNAQAQPKGKEYYEAIRPFVGRVAPAKLNGKWGFVSQAGNWVVKPLYDEVLPFEKAFTYVKLKEKWGVINMQGQVIQPAIYSGWEEVAGIRRLFK